MKINYDATTKKFTIEFTLSEEEITELNALLAAGDLYCSVAFSPPPTKSLGYSKQVDSITSVAS